MFRCILVFFTVFLKNRNIISKIERSKVTDYAALRLKIIFTVCHFNDQAFIIIPCVTEMVILMPTREKVKSGLISFSIDQN